MCAFLATPQLFFQTGNCLLCTGRDQSAACEPLPALHAGCVDATRDAERSVLPLRG